MKKAILWLITALIPGFVAGQFSFRGIPVSDSIFTKEYEGKITEKKYYKNNRLILQTDYGNNYGNLYHMFSNERGVDSSYIFVDQDTYDLYFFNSESIVNEKFSYTSTIYYYFKYSVPGNEKTEEGRYYVVKDHFYNIVQGPRYKIGNWNKYKGGKIIETINYDNFLFNGEKISFKSNEKALLNRIKQKTDSLVLSTFGDKFAKRYIVFNLDKSRFGTNLQHMGPDQPSGRYLLSESDEQAEYADMCYDIRINDTLRFDAIMIRIDKGLNIIGERRFENYGRREFNLCVGLDNSLKKGFNKNALDFSKIADDNGFNFQGRNFYLRMEWEHTNGLFGKLYFVMEEEIRTEDKENGWTTYYKRLKIDPLTGRQDILNDDKNSETIEIDFDF